MTCAALSPIILRQNKMTKWVKDNFEISTDKSKLNLEVIFQFLKESYWANDRTYSQVVHSIQNSLCFGLHENGIQVGFARVITDYATFAYLADVFIIRSYQGKGLGKWLTEVIINNEDLKNITSWLLLTNDAHFLYEKAGFMQYPYPERVMMKNAKLLKQTDQNNLR